MSVSKEPVPSPEEVAAEMDRLAGRGLGDLGYSDEELERLAGLTWRINTLKREVQAVIPAHVYQRAEVLHGVSDYSGDSYKLAKDCVGTKAKHIIFCGVRFMAETAKILNPDKDVHLPAAEAGCSLSESITGADVRKLKAKHPGLPVATYINTSAEVKAESDVVVTSANASKILRKLYARHERVIFIPDEMMGKNLARELGKKVGTEMVIWEGRCIVHDHFDSESIDLYRKMYPGVKILAHAECSPSLTSLVDMVGGTGDMMRFVEGTKARSYMLVTECGLGDLARTRFPEKLFVPMCRLCPYMKATTLERILDCLKGLGKATCSTRVEVAPEVAQNARRSVEKMFELAEDKAQS